MFQNVKPNADIKSCIFKTFLISVPSSWAVLQKKQVPAAFAAGTCGSPLVSGLENGRHDNAKHHSGGNSASSGGESSGQNP